MSNRIQLLLKSLLNPQQLQLLLQEELNQYQSEVLNPIEWILENEKIQVFQPNASQMRWIEAIKQPGAFIVINAAGNGTGKTWGIASILAAFCWSDIAPECFQAPPFVGFKGPRRARIISTPKELEDIGTLQLAIKELWPKNRYRADKNNKSYFSQFATDTGWIIDLMSYEQSITEFGGANLGLVFFNEPPPKPIYDESVMRTRSGGLILPAFTSLRENPWVVDGLLGRANGKDIILIHGDIEDNCKQHSKNGTLEHSQIERILSQYDPDEREARKTGKPLRFSGRIYKTFDPAIHVSREPIKPPESGIAHYMVCDPAIGKPVYAIWAYVDVTGIIRIYDEYPNTEFEGAKDVGLTMKEYADIFRAKEVEHGVRDITRIIDRHFGNTRRNPGGLSFRDEWAEDKNGGLEFIDSYSVSGESSEIETGIQAVKDRLGYDRTRPMDPLNSPKLEISCTCLNTIKALERWTRNPDTLKPTEAYKDANDCIRYLVKANPEIDIPQQWGKGSRPFYGVQ